MVARTPGGEGQGLQGQRALARRDPVRLLQGTGQGDVAREPALRGEGQAGVQDRREEDKGGRWGRRSHRIGGYWVFYFVGFSFDWIINLNLFNCCWNWI